MKEKVAVILVNHKEYAKNFLGDCIDSLRKQDYSGEISFFIVDNESSDESFAFIKSIVSEAEIIRNEKNEGFAKGNNDGIRLALRNNFKYILLLNMDTVVKNDCVKKLVGIMEDENIKNGKREIGAAQARLMIHGEENKINSLGNSIHFLGFGYCKGYGDEYDSANFLDESADILFPSGAAVLFTREALLKAGLFDEEFWMYNEDEDLGWRLWLLGYKCVTVRDAVVYHKYKFSRNVSKYYQLERNRIITILKNYHWATFFLVLPAFLTMELGLILFSFLNGWLAEKLRSYKYFLSVKNWRHIINARKKIQSSRLVRERDIIKMFSGKIWYQEIGDWKLILANKIFNFYWKVVKFFIFW